ncbi:spermidine synthase [Streptomyces sp. HNM0574]|uniref:spermidine synthase n=1 Tax=Streptomyces sp. HNM0574 TaxID=2714954 RepID=UPI001F103C76|nr:spermidine synthase [Streptomyces sp. HNM0574]
MPYETLEPPLVLDRRMGPHGEVVLRRHGELLQIIANGCFLMDTSDGRSERLLVRAALRELDGRPAPSLLLGGLGVGFSLAEAAAEPRWGEITVAEREQAIIDWHRPGAPLADVSAEALADPRVRIAHTDLVAHLSGPAATPPTTATRAPSPIPDSAAEKGQQGSSGTGPSGPAGNLHKNGTSSAPTDSTFPPTQASPAAYDVMCLDIDNGPDWTVTADNTTLYSPDGLAACRESLTPGGVLAVWSAQPSPTFEDALRNTGFTRVRTEEIRVVRGVPDVVHIATKPA